MASSRADDEQSPLAKDAAPVDQSSATSSQESSTKPDDNPFIQFRRYADSQVSSLLQSVIGLPSLFTQPSPKGRWIAIKSDGDKVVVDGDEVTLRQQKEIEEGWKKQREQIAEERERAADLRRRQSMREWGWSDGTAAEEASTPARRYPNGDLMPEASPAGALDRMGRNFRDMLGWDGKQKHESAEEPQTPPAEAPTKPDPSSPSANLVTAQFDPFSGRPDEAIPWLLRDKYSPIFLRGHLPKDIDITSDAYKHALEHPHWPDFRAASSLDRFKKELRFEVSWCDAFEDLVSLENTGRMVDREGPTRTSSTQWIADMLARGSLQQDPRVMSKRFGMPASLFASPGSSLLRPSLAELFDMMHEAGESLDEVRDALDEAQDATWERADSHSRHPPQFILAAMKKAAETPEQVWEDENEQGFCENRDDETELAMYEALDAAKETEKSETKSTATPTISTSATSSSSSSWTRSSDEQKDSIVSTMTTTETRTLPDGSVETRRMLKKRFADGREESNETVETQMPKRKDIRAPETEAETKLPAEKQDQGTQTQSDGKDAKAGRKGSGWFWL